MNLTDLQSRLGQQIALSDWVTVTQERIDAFADATGDHQFIHVDLEKAAAGPFGAPIAHGFLTLSLLAGELSNAGGGVRIGGGRMTVNYGLNRVRFVAPVRVGSRLRNRAVLQALEEGQGAGGQRYLQLTLLNTIEIEGDTKPACTAESLMRVYL